MVCTKVFENLFPEHRALHSFPTRRSSDLHGRDDAEAGHGVGGLVEDGDGSVVFAFDHHAAVRSEEHTSELQSRGHLVCRVLLEKKKCSYPVLSTTDYTPPYATAQMLNWDN